MHRIKNVEETWSVLCRGMTNILLKKNPNRTSRDENCNVWGENYMEWDNGRLVANKGKISKFKDIAIETNSNKTQKKTEKNKWTQHQWAVT